MGSRLKLIVSYDGASFSGWQSQRSRNAIQDHLENAFQRICGKQVRLHGAGRTDAGVHALGQCAHVDLPHHRYEPERWLSALNGLLPPTIRVMRCRFVSQTFHARYSAKGKTYRYRIWNAAVLPPFEYGRTWHVTTPLDFEGMRLAARPFAGQHDFFSFSANRGTPQTNTIRTIHAVRLRRSGPCISIEFDGDGFLYKMVRMMVDPLVRIGLKKAGAEEIKNRLNEPRMKAFGSRIVTPPNGLFLVRVRY